MPMVITSTNEKGLSVAYYLVAPPVVKMEMVLSLAVLPKLMRDVGKLLKEFALVAHAERKKVSVVTCLGILLLPIVTSTLFVKGQK